MKTLPGKGKVSGLTLIELLVVIAVIAVLAAILLPSLPNRDKRAKIPWCMSNQKQIAIALIMFQDDHGGKCPWQVSTTNNGSLERISNGMASDQFLAITTYLGNRPQVLICPADKGRLTATSYSTITNTNISYFLNLDATPNLNSILTGDRNLEFAWKPINSGIFVQTTNTTVKWSEGFHQAQGKPAGVFLFADSHAQYIRQDYLDRTLQNQPLATNRFCIP